MSTSYNLPQIFNIIVKDIEEENAKEALYDYKETVSVHCRAVEYMNFPRGHGSKPKSDASSC